MFLLQVVQLLKKRKDSTLRLDNIILLLVHIYCLEGDADAGAFDQEDRRKSVLAECSVQEGVGLSAALQKFGPFSQPLLYRIFFYNHLFNFSWYARR